MKSSKPPRLARGLLAACAGIIRIAIGDNWESGGTLRTTGHEDGWLFVTDGTLTSSGVRVVEKGNPVGLPEVRRPPEN